MQAFTYHTPHSLEEALTLLGGGGAGRPLAGGTDLFLALEHGPALADGSPPRVVDLKHIPGLDGIETGGPAWRIGALATMAAIEAHPALRTATPALCAAAAVVGGPNIRNRATLGGNLCNASPAADTATPLLALGASVTVQGAGGARTLPLGQFWLGPRKTALQPGELVTAIEMPAPAGGNAFTRATRSQMDIATVNAAATVTLDGAGHIASATLALGAVGPTVLAVNMTAVNGQAPGAELLERVATLAREAAQPISDTRASADYRRDLAGTLAARAFDQACQMARGGK